MPYNGDLVGARLGPIAWTATTRRLLAFRAVLAPDDAGGLDDAAGPLEALAMQVVSPEWVLALMARDLPGQALSGEEQRRGVHVSQDSRFLAPIRAGDALRVSGEIVGVRGSRAGAVVTTRYETHGPAEALLAVSTSVSILRGVAVTGPERPEPTEASWPAFSAVGAPRPMFTPRGFPHQYSECAEIWNPIHTERAVALAAGLDDILIHGTALWALAGLALTPRGGLTRLAARFRSPAWAGEPMALQAGATAGDQTPFQLTAPDGRLLCEGFAQG